MNWMEFQCFVLSSSSSPSFFFFRFSLLCSLIRNNNNNSDDGRFSSCLVLSRLCDVFLDELDMLSVKCSVL